MEEFPMICGAVLSRVALIYIVLAPPFVMAGRLDEALFKPGVQSSIPIDLTSVETLPKWQHILFEGVPRKERVELEYPVQTLLRNLEGTGSSQLLEVVSVEVEVGTHGSYFRVVYGVQMRLVARKKDDSAPVGLSGSASFIGKREKKYLDSPEGRQMLANAIMRALARIKVEPSPQPKG